MLAKKQKVTSGAGDTVRSANKTPPTRSATPLVAVPGSSSGTLAGAAWATPPMASVNIAQAAASTIGLNNFFIDIVL